MEAVGWEGPMWGAELGGPLSFPAGKERGTIKAQGFMSRGGGRWATVGAGSGPGIRDSQP